MKKPPSLIFYGKILIITLLIVTSLMLFPGNPSGERLLFEGHGESEEAGGIPGVLKAMDLWSEMRTYPFKRMDASHFSGSFEQSRRMGFVSRGDGSDVGLYSVSTPPWTSLAPMNFAGRMLSIAFHPTDANIMWAGSASGGLWKTTTGGTGGPGGISWQYIPTGFPVLGVSSIVINPLNGNEIYIGTGEVYSINPAGTGSTGAGHVRTFRGSYGIGILKTTNGGTTWTKTLNFDSSGLKGVMDMVIHPTNPDTVFAATTDGIYRTFDAGANWSLIHTPDLPMDLCFKPGNPNVLYAGVGNFGSTGTGVYKTTNANAVSPTFNLINTGLPGTISGKIMLAISAATPTKIYASVGKDPNTSHTQGLYVSTNEGASWAAAGVANMLGTQGWYAHDVGVSPNDANRLLWAELNTFYSTNGGTSTTQSGTWSEWDIDNTTIGDLTEGQADAVETDYVHADVHRIVASPHDGTGNTFFLCTDGGIFRTTNGGANFNTLNGGLNTAQIYANMAIHPGNANYMLLGLQDNEAMVYEGTQGSRRIGGLGDGFHAAMNSTGNIQLVESYYFNRKRSTDNGFSWGASSGAVAEVACFNVPMVFSKEAASTYMFAGTALFKRSINSGSTWANLNSGNPIAGANNPCIAMAAPTDNIVYFSTAPAAGIRSKLWKTTNATNSAATVTFSEITGTLPDRYYSKIVVDPANSSRLAVTLSGFGSSHVYLSNNGGSSWSDIGGGLPDIPHNTAMFDPNETGTLYVGNDVGVFYANNVPTGSLAATTPLTWTAYNEGFGDAVMVSDIGITHTNKLRLGSYGRGLWERDPAPNISLPVTFKSFTAAGTAIGNQLKWIVSAQTNVKQYEAEYSTDGLHFNKLAVVPVKNTAGDISYGYLHAIHNTVNGYYRIKSVDLDGSFTYSPVEEVRAIKLLAQMTAYPNPTTGLFKVKLPVQAAGHVNLKVYDQGGRLVLLKKFALPAGNHEIPVNISGYAAGTYQVICENDKIRWVTKILKR